jgi:PAS domain S-box-containing protein
MDKAKILIVDNHPSTLKLLESFFTDRGNQVKSALGGLEAIDILKDFTPDIAFIDMIMPHIDGVKLTNYIRTEYPGRNIVIVIVSGVAKEADSVDLPEGADAFIAKGPFGSMKEHIDEIVTQFEKHGHYPKSLSKIYGVNGLYFREVTKELLFSRRHLEAILQHTREGVVELSQDFRIVYLNQAASLFLKHRDRELIGRDFSSVFDKEISEKVLTMVYDALNSGEVQETQEPIFVNERYIEFSIMFIQDGETVALLVFMRDMTLEHLAHISVKDSLVAKETLLKEIHHRVKNNLMMITGILELQKDLVDEHEFLEDIINRIHAISLIHDKLYRSRDIKTIHFHEYVSELSFLILENLTDHQIKMTVDIPASTFSVEGAIPLAIILTESLTNAVKYGFPEQNHVSPEAEIRVELQESEDNYIFIVKNNGSSLPEGFELKQNEGLGTSLIDTMAEQLEGTFRLFQEGEFVKTEVVLPKRNVLLELDQ